MLSCFSTLAKMPQGRKVENYTSQHAVRERGGGARGGTKLSFLGTKKNREKESKPRASRLGIALESGQVIIDDE